MNICSLLAMQLCGLGKQGFDKVMTMLDIKHNLFGFSKEEQKVACILKKLGNKIVKENLETEKFLTRTDPIYHKEIGKVKNRLV